MSGRRTAIFALLYASEGAPIGFIWWALPTLLRTAGVGVGDITALTALLVLPWVGKFLWAPVLDVLRGPRWGYRHWIVAAQVLMAGTLVPLIWLAPATHLDAWRALLLAHAVAAATQDIAIDALVISSVTPAERGRLNGAMQAGMLLGRSAFGGGVLLVGATWGLDAIVVALVAWICVPIAAVRRLPEPDVTTRAIGQAPMARALVQILRLPTTWAGLGFALTGAAAFEAAGQLAGPFLVDRGVATEQIGVFFGVVVIGATLAGGLLGGWLSDRWGRERSVTVFLGVVIAAVGGLGWIDRGGDTDPSTALAWLTVMYVGVGLFTVATYALFMDLTHPRLGATQFTTFMAATNGCEAWAGWAGGRLVEASGYGTAFLLMAAVSLAGGLWLVPLRRHRSDA